MLSRSLRLLFLAALPGCTLVRVDADDGPPRLEAGGLIDGHLAVGVPANTSLVDVDLFDGDSEGALAQLKLWKLLRVEVGLAGATLGVGPLDLGLGVLAYDPRPWVRSRSRRVEAVEPEAPGPDPAAARPMEVDVDPAPAR